MISCGEDECSIEANVWVEGEVYCTDHGVQRANFLESHTCPIISLEEFIELEEGDMQYFDPQTVIWSGKEEADIWAFDDIGRRQRIVVTDGLTIYREPIVMARCIVCEAVGIGHINKVGGWLARHTHYHNFGTPDSDFAGVAHEP